MRTLSEFVENLQKSVDLPIAYHHFKSGQAPELPYLIYYSIGNDDLKADNINYVKFRQVNVEFYTNKKDVASEEKITSFFDANEIAYDTFESYIEEEKMYEVLYEIIL